MVPNIHISSYMLALNNIVFLYFTEGGIQSKTIDTALELSSVRQKLLFVKNNLPVQMSSIYKELHWCN